MLYGLHGVLTKMQTKSIPYTFNRCGYYYFSRRVPADLIGFIEINQNGYFDRGTLHGDLTRYIAKDELLERFTELDGHLA